MQDNRAVQKNYEPELINVRRNPYLIDYEEQRRGTAQRQRASQSVRRESTGQVYRNGTTGERQPRPAYGQDTRRPAGRTGEPRTAYGQSTRQSAGRTGEPRTAYGQSTRQSIGRTGEPRTAYGQSTRQSIGRTGEPRTAYGQSTRQSAGRTGEPRTAYGQSTRRPAGRTGELRPIYGQDMRQGAGRPKTQGGRQSREAMLRERRRKQLRRQKIAVGIWAVCIIAISSVLFLNHSNASAAEPSGTSQDRQQQQQESLPSDVSGTMIQGLPAEKFTAHPEWTENFLTPNEYSRPGEPLTEIKDVFVHYTANPGTSAAQNRSYFEQQKDTHMASVSSHFIIGYEGEIIQCVPLDEIAYAVASRNYDSISIECCYTAQDGSFTKETYDSLISLLAWLTDAYDLDTSHILRHYDCGGKKCPIYYTENEDEWEQLKRDVKAYK